MSETRDVCLRCGNFLEAAALGIPLCASCLEGAPPPKDQVFTYPPRSIVWKRIRPFTLLGFVLGFAGAFVAFQRRLTLYPRATSLVLVAIFGALLVGALTSVIGELTGIVFLYLALPLNPMKEWRRILLEKLGLPKDGPFSLVLFARRNVKVTDVRMPLEIGLLAVSEGGLVFLGERGTRFSLARTEITKTGRNVLAFLPPRLATRVELADGRAIFFVPLESRSPWESLRLTRELGARLRNR